MIQRIGVYGKETGLTERLEGFCKGEQLEMTGVANQEKLQNMIRGEMLHAVILDIAVDEQGVGEGIQLIRRLRGLGCLPLLVVSSQKSERAKIAALSMGADDYMTGDENPLVLKARIKSQLRRVTQLSAGEAEKGRVYSVDELRVEDPQGLLLQLPEESRQALLETLRLDPRPRYQHDAARVYSMPFDRWVIRFSVDGDRCSLLSVE